MSKKPIALEERDAVQGRLKSPSAARNRDVIKDILVKHLPTTGTILEVGAGTGEHAVHFAAGLPNVRWVPGDPDETSRASIDAWRADSSLQNIAPAHAINVTNDQWQWDGEDALSGLVSLNMIHIAPFEAAKGLIAGAGRYLRAGGVFFLYGPFSREGVHTAPSNAAFDQSLKSRDERWGVRDLDHDIVPLAATARLKLDHIIEMPTNNLSVVFSKE